MRIAESGVKSAVFSKAKYFEFNIGGKHAREFYYCLVRILSSFCCYGRKKHLLGTIKLKMQGTAFAVLL
jgi:hypothetical protein